MSHERMPNALATLEYVKIATKRTWNLILASDSST
jgi:hypothetical protein